MNDITRPPAETATWTPDLHARALELLAQLEAEIRQVEEFAEPIRQAHELAPEVVRRADVRAVTRMALAPGDRAAQRAAHATMTRWRARTARLAADLTRPRPQAPRRAEARPRAPRRSPRRGTVKTAQDPGDPDPDPVEVRVRELVGQAPPFSPGQRALLGRILGGA